MDPSQSQPRSEFRAMLEQIELETRAAHTAMSEFRSGEARHAFITMRMERSQKIAAQLIEEAGPEALPAIIATIDSAFSLSPKQKG
jgi:hypothetical protein